MEQSLFGINLYLYPMLDDKETLDIDEQETLEDEEDDSDEEESSEESSF
jgi:hypothetical protein